MIKLELFKPKSYFHQTKEVITSIINTSKLPDTVMRMEDKDAEIPFRDRMAAFNITNTYLKNRKFNECQFGTRFGGKLKSEYDFDELLFTIGHKDNMASCHFTTDALGKVICYNLYVVRTKQYVEDKRNQNTTCRGVIDPYSFVPMPLKDVQAKFSTHPIYQEFMDQLGKTAVR